MKDGLQLYQRTLLDFLVNLDQLLLRYLEVAIKTFIQTIRNVFSVVFTLRTTM